MEANWLVPSAIVWAIVISIYVPICMIAIKDLPPKPPMWAWPGLVIAMAVAVAILGTIFVMLAYPFYYFLYL